MSRRGLSALAGIVCVVIALVGCQRAAPACRLARQADTRTLRKCTLLLPLAYNDGTPVSLEVLAQIEDRLFNRFGGYTIAGTAEGAYRMADGTQAKDRSLVLWVAVPADRVDDLRRAVAGIARELRQESVYFEVSDATVEFVGATESN